MPTRSRPPELCCGPHTPSHLPPPTSLPLCPQKFDPDNSKNLALDEYIRSCLFLQTAARSFAAFDPNKTGSVTLSFSQLVYVCGHIAC